MCGSLRESVLGETASPGHCTKVTGSSLASHESSSTLEFNISSMTISILAFSPEFEGLLGGIQELKKETGIEYLNVPAKQCLLHSCIGCVPRAKNMETIPETNECLNILRVEQECVVSHSPQVGLKERESTC